MFRLSTPTRLSPHESDFVLAANSTPSNGEKDGGVQEALTSRRTVYRYKRKKVPDRTLESAFEAASNAPCHKNTHPWKFYVMGEKTRESLIPEIEKWRRKNRQMEKN
ncbi:MAG: hypothetical protein Ct9H90mP24_4270 [Methanobacteriota archaeon]|nr:MAG: hypothetical protein Ct9H90mP24_4270 [Euryarchaeota archaeon]